MPQSRGRGTSSGMTERTLEAAQNASFRRRRLLLPLHDSLGVCLQTPWRAARTGGWAGALHAEWPLRLPYSGRILGIVVLPNALCAGLTKKKTTISTYPQQGVCFPPAGERCWGGASQEARLRFQQSAILDFQRSGHWWDDFGAPQMPAPRRSPGSRPSSGTPRKP